ncbi:hypothetical protein LMG31506_02987 [Cupriavidus yeoncheonensis]|uniref:Phage tail protein n=1 Tax=Cupriavidus yeoncheonensis TaxID=1462994 RepID=A0A916N445_9BURK|nr:contractile injection system protein, VgrG/Pvc8 family [Cupriavidus yeoncheonensis]CAG2144349.1 hypothetical protein LMG31506_02987 [Cupriavidus yeoncheonensis]
MGLKPEFRLIANSEDITAAIKDRLVSLRYTDAAGMDSDMLEIVLADHDPAAPLMVPGDGAELQLFLGYDGAAEFVGLFVFDELEMGGPPDEMVIRARAAPFAASKNGKNTLQSQKTRSWAANTKLGDMVRKIAKEHGMDAAVSKALDATPLPHIDQADESDLHLLVRIGKRYDALVKPAGGKLILAKRGEAKAVGGADLPTVTLTPNERTSWRTVQSKRETAGMVVAYWHAVKQARRNEVSVGSGEPVRRIKQYFPTQEMALAAARAELARRERGRITLSVLMPGRTDLVAEAKLVLQGWRQGVPTEWLVTRVEHRLDVGGYSCAVEAEQPDDSTTA